ncbi:MAG: RecB family exonuclease [Candidatus Woesearchaeota archaeon]
MYSHSRVQTYRTCPLKYKWAYIDKIKPPIPQTVEAFLGSLVHDALEKLYADLMFEKENSLQDLLDYYNDRWKKEWKDDILIVRKDYNSENYRQMGERFITDYYNKHKPFNHDRTIAVEERVVFPLDSEEKCWMQGYIDRLSYEGDGIYVVHDYKTAKNLKSVEDAEEDPQLALYSMAVKKKYQDCRDVKLVWHMLAHDKAVESKRTDDELEELRKQTLELIKEIESAKQFPSRQSPLCPWCSFRPMCPHFKHMFEAQKALTNPYLQEEGQTLVNKYAALKQKEQEIKDELEKLKDAIFSYGERKGVDALYGDGLRLKLWSKECVKLPDKKDPLQVELVKLLKSIGKFDDIAVVDTWQLGKILENKEWPDELVRLFDGFVRKDTVRRIYMSDM